MEIDCSHDWEYFVADPPHGPSYYFCRWCRHTLLPGRGIFGFKEDA